MLGVQGKYHMYCMMTKSFSFIGQLTTTERAKCWGFYRFRDVHVEFKTFSRLKTINLGIDRNLDKCSSKSFSSDVLQTYSYLGTTQSEES